MTGTLHACFILVGNKLFFSYSFFPLIGCHKEQVGGALRSLTSYRSNNRKKTPLRRVKCELLAHMDYF